jgi:hypothetical protein
MVAHQVIWPIFSLGPALRPTWPTSGVVSLLRTPEPPPPTRSALPCRAPSLAAPSSARHPSPLINLAPRQLLSLLHSMKRPVLNFHHRRSVTSSDPLPRRPDAIKGARSHGHFTHSILPHLAPLIHAPSHPTPSTDAVFHSSPPSAQPRHRAT